MIQASPMSLFATRADHDANKKRLAGFLVSRDIRMDSYEHMLYDKEIPFADWFFDKLPKGINVEYDNDVSVDEIIAFRSEIEEWMKK